MRILVRSALFMLGCLLLLGSGLVAYTRRDAEKEVMWIYYASVDAGGKTGLHRMLSDGTGHQVLLSDTGFITRISVSPDGSSIMFDADHNDGISQVYQASAVGGNVRLISRGLEEAYAPAWSPDGEWIAFMVCSQRDLAYGTSPASTCYTGYSGQQGVASVYLMRPDGTDQQQMTESVPLGRPFWSPDGEWIAYVSPGINGADISRIRADGEVNERLTDVDLAETYADQPPFVKSPNNQPAQAVPIFPAGGRDLSPTWSADGNQIAFLSNRFEDSNTGYYDLDVFVMNADGSNIRRLTNTDGQTGAPQWSADGEWVAFVDDSEGVYNIYRVRPDGTDMQKLTNNSYQPINSNNGRGNMFNNQASSWAPAWSPVIQLAQMEWEQPWAFVGGGLFLFSIIVTIKRHEEFSSTSFYRTNH